MAPDRPSFEKSPPELVARFDWLAGRFPEAERRKMFGYPALFVGGNLVTGLFGPAWMIRLPPDAAAGGREGESGLSEPSALPPFEPMPGRPMKGYALLPRDVVADDERLAAWVRRAVDHVASLPPKRQS